MDLFKKVTDYKSDFTTYARSFEGYKWYKSILVVVLTLIISTILQFVMLVLLSGSTGTDLLNILVGLNVGYNGLNTYSLRGLIMLAGTALLFPAFFIAAKIVKERPISSYFYSRAKWNWKLFIYPFILTVAILIIPSIYLIYAHGLTFNNHFTVLTLILTLILTPLQTWGEEVIFRGALMQTIGSWFKIPALAIILSALIFLLVHPYNLIGQIDILFYGIYYGIVSWKTKGLEASMAMHAANNMFLFVLLGVDLYFFGKDTSMEIFLLNAIFTGIITIIVLTLNNKYNWSEE